MQTTEIKRYAIVLLKGWWLIGLCMLAVGGVAVAVFGSQPPSYTAANTFAITQRDNVSPSSTNVLFYTDLIYKGPILEEVITSLGLERQILPMSCRGCSMIKAASCSLPTAMPLVRGCGWWSMPSQVPTPRVLPSAKRLSWSLLWARWSRLAC